MRRLADAREQVEVWRGVETKASESLELLRLADQLSKGRRLQPAHR